MKLTDVLGCHLLYFRNFHKGILLTNKVTAQEILQEFGHVVQLIQGLKGKKIIHKNTSASFLLCKSKLVKIGLICKWMRIDYL